MRKYLSAILALTAVLLMQVGCTATIQPTNSDADLSSSSSAENPQGNAAPNNNAKGDTAKKNSSSSATSASVKEATTKLAKVTAISDTNITVKLSSQPTGNGAQGGKMPSGASGAGEKPNGQPPQAAPDANASSGGNSVNTGKTPPNGGGRQGFSFDGEEKTIAVTDESIIFTSNGKEQAAAKLADIKVDTILELKYSNDKLVSIVIRPTMDKNPAPTNASLSSKAA